MLHVPDLGEVVVFLKECGLPTADLTSGHMEQFYALSDSRGVIGIVGLELFGKVALLRSLAVEVSHRGSGHGRTLVTYAEAIAWDAGVRSIFLLTTTAGNFFEKIGYKVADRSDAPIQIRNTYEFTTLCAATAHLLSKTNPK